tara:strand:- start:3746 stop:3982 length:237 start_codon:yes stop_codon:yes gene_type:complete
MAFVSKTALRPNITKGSIIAFVENPCTYQQTNIQYITSYFNPVTGLYDSAKTMIYFEGSEPLLINQAYATTSTELLAI